MSGSGKSLATKSRWKSPDKFFPVVVDDFFENPKGIVKYGKSLGLKSRGRHPGKRSDNLWNIDKPLHNALILKALSCYYDLDYISVEWESSLIEFNEIPRYAKDKNDVKNKGWIHQDVDILGNDDLAGVIYLTPDIDPDSGTSLWTVKPDRKVIINAEDEGSEPGQGEEYAKQYSKQMENLVEKFRFQNFFNRMIMYDTNEFHGANSYWNDDDKDARLTVVFFIGGIVSSGDYPLKRVKNNDLENIINARIATADMK